MKRQPLTALPLQPTTQPTRKSFSILANTLLTTSNELPRISRARVRGLLLLVQAMYLAFYLGALANLTEVYDIFSASRQLAPGPL